MILVETGRLESNGFGWVNKDCYFCLATFGEYFDIPERTKAVWLIAHSAPTKHSYPVTVTADFRAYVHGLIGALYCESVNFNVVQQLENRQLIGKLIHVECFYAFSI